MTHLSNDQLLEYLDIISRIPENGKLCNYKNKISIDNNTILSPLFRFYHNDSRENTIKFLNNIIFKVINTIKKTSDDYIEFNKKATKLLKSSIIGINNLKSTYNNDYVIVHKLNLLIDKINKFNNNTNDIDTFILQKLTSFELYEKYSS